MEEERNYHAYSQSTLEYCTTENGSYIRLYGLKVIPDIGSEPEDIETTTLDNKKFKTAIAGLQDVQKYTFEFNMEDPSAESNYKKACDLEDAGTVQYWKLTLSNGVVISFRSKVTTAIKGGEYGDLIGFTMTLTPIGEPKKTIPTSNGRTVAGE